MNRVSAAIRAPLLLAIMWLAASLVAIMIAVVGSIFGAWSWRIEGALVGMSIVHGVGSAMVVSVLLMRPGHRRAWLGDVAIGLVCSVLFSGTLLAFGPHVMRWLSAAESSVAAAILAWKVEGEERLFFGVMTLGWLAVFAFMLALMSRTRAIHGLHTAARVVALAFALGAAAVSLSMACLRPDSRMLGAWIVLAVSMTACVMLAVTIGTLAELIGVARRRRMARGRVSISMGCPMCGEMQTAGQGPARCKGCRAKFVVEVEEPACECGYSHLHLTGDVCPECGRPLPQTPRWSPNEPASASAT
jgi:hypothetical protein